MSTDSSTVPLSIGEIGWRIQLTRGQRVVLDADLAASHRDLANRLTELEHKTEALAMRYHTFSRNTRVQLKHVFDAIR